MHCEKSGLATFFHEGKSMWQSRCTRHKQHVAKISENASEQKHCASKDADFSDWIAQQKAYEKNAIALPLELRITDALRGAVSFLGKVLIDAFDERAEIIQSNCNSSQDDTEIMDGDTFRNILNFRHKNSVLFWLKSGRAECVAGGRRPATHLILEKLRVFAITALIAIIALFQLSILSGTALAGSLPYQAKAQVLYVIDGDTFRAQVQIWQDLMIETNIRVARIDTPEKKRGSECEAERQAGYAASAYAKQFLHKNDQVILSGMKPGKYAGRIIAEVQLADGQNFSDLMLNSGHAIPYEGGRKNKIWCPQMKLQEK